LLGLATLALLGGGAWFALSAPTSPAARLEAADRALEAGRFAEAEALLEPALLDGGPAAVEARKKLVQLDMLEGRFDEAFPLLEANWRAQHGPNALATLRAFVELDLGSLPLEGLGRKLDEARRKAPDDDRVTLALANLAIRLGHFDEAARLLDACQARRPDDPAVSRSRFFLALATGRDDQARAALDRLAGDRHADTLNALLRACRAARSGDAAAERQALDDLLAINPADFAALERRIGLEVQAGHVAEAARLRATKETLDRAKRDYIALVDDGIQDHGAALARLAERLGKPFEARAFAKLAVSPDENDREFRDLTARLDGRTSTAMRPVVPISSLLGDRAATTESTAARLSFADDADRAGLRFVYQNGRTPRRQVPETMGGGVALLDFDGDGWMDVYAVQGGMFPPDPKSPPDGDRLFRNRGDGTFEDATASSGIASFPRGYGHGVTVGDFDNDGRPDLFVARWRSYALYHNLGGGRFEDVTDRADLGGDRGWPTSAAFADLDDDGDLDLYVCHYVEWDEDHPRLCESPSNKGYLYCGPVVLTAVPDHVFRNDGGKFVDVTESAGFVDRDGRGLGVLVADLDGDGRVDVYVANDGSANLLFRNKGPWRFEEAASAMGVAGNASGGYQGGMGLACGDLDGDGRPELVVTNFYGESTTVYQNHGRGLFSDRTAAVGVAAATRYMVGFGVALEDINNDGFLDLMQTNGHVNEYDPPIYPYAMPTQLFLGARGGRLRDATAAAGPAWTTPRVGRGLAAGDLDNDGKLDVVVLPENGPLAYLHNRSDRTGHFLTLCLEGTTSNRDAVGARVTVTAGGRRWVAQRVGGGSYQSAHDPRLHFGLGASTQVDSLEIRWPSGRVDRHGPLAADRGYLLREGSSEAPPLPSFPE
jgi:hypothetical protein